MKNLIWLLLFTFASSAYADEYGRGTYSFKDEEIGEMKITVRDIGETVDVMKVEVLCYEKRSQPGSVPPKLEVISLTRDKEPTIPVCYYRERPDTYDSRTKLLTIRYSQLAEGPGGQARCALHQSTSLDMRRWCHAFQPGH